LADTRAEAANYGRDKWEDEMATYGKKSQETVKEVMEKFKKGELKSGKDGEIVTDRKQAVAIGLSEAREKGAKVPEPPKK
jgi:mevalonate pyrophosphate decarboxylase